MTANRPANWFVAAVAVVVLAAVSSGLWLARPWGDPTPRHADPAISRSTGTFGEVESPEEADRRVFGLALPDEGAESDQPEPADLPAPPDGRRLSRSTYPGPGRTLEVSVWEVADGDPARLASYYRQVASEAGFTFVRKTLDQTTGTHRLFMRRNDRWLQVDCRPAGKSTRVVVNLR